MSLPLILLATAWAQDASTVAVPELNSQLYRMPIDAEATMWTDDAGLAPDKYTLGKLMLGYVNDPFIFESDDGTQTRLVSDALFGSLIGGTTIWRLRFGLDVPFYLFTAGEVEGGGAGLGDIAVDLKGTILDREDAPLGLALGGRLALPTGSTSLPLSAPGLSWEVQAIADKRMGDVLLAANVGTRGVPPAVMDNVNWNDQFFYRLGGGFALSEVSGISLDLAGQLNYSNPLSNGASNPLEGILGGWYRVADDWVLRGGVGTGLSGGIGSPDARVIVSFGYEPPRVKDTDKDGLRDDVDACPEVAEDFDNYKDDDGCPDPKTQLTLRFEDEEGVRIDLVAAMLDGDGGPYETGANQPLEVHPGTYMLQAAATGFDPIEVNIAVPEVEQHEVVQQLRFTRGVLEVRVVDPEGKPLDATLRVDRGRPAAVRLGTRSDPSIGGDPDVSEQADGYLPQSQPATVAAGETTVVTFTMMPARATVTKEKIEIADKVYFETAKAAIKPESFGLLDDVASILVANPEITKIRIEGHTDSRGNADYNRKLSDARAASVRQYLIDKGVEAGRLESIGYGEDKPVDTANNAAAWEKNRRVDFFVVERSDD